MKVFLYFSILPPKYPCKGLGRWLTGSVQGTFKKAIVSKIRFTEASNEAELMRIEEGGVRDTGESAIGVIDSATAKRVLTEF
jgi:hypothetical protein